MDLSKFNSENLRTYHFGEMLALLEQSTLSYGVISEMQLPYNSDFKSAMSLFKSLNRSVQHEILLRDSNYVMGVLLGLVIATHCHYLDINPEVKQLNCELKKVKL